MILKYKDYIGVVEIEKDNIQNPVLRGHIIGIRDVITFYSYSVGEIQIEFQTSIDEYLNFCKDQNDEPEKPNPHFLLINQFNAKIWAEEFIKKCKSDPYICTDENIMLNWFANAIMTGYDRGIEDGKNM